METNKITLAALLSALFVVLSLTFMGTGIAYTLYLDMMVPILIALIYLVCGRKYTLLSCITSIFIIILVLGDFISGIWMIQSMLMGLFCGKYIIKDSNMNDDLVKCALFACVIMIIIDIYFSGFLGYSFLKDFKETIDKIDFNGFNKDIAFYIMVAALPVGTIILTYYATLLLGKKFKVLNEVAMRKYNVLINSKKYSPYYCCSKNVIYCCISYVSIIFILEFFNINIINAYFKALVTAINYVLLFVLIKDNILFTRRVIFMKTKMMFLDMMITGTMVFCLVKRFKLTVIITTIISVAINLKTKMREKQISFVYDITVVNSKN